MACVVGGEGDRAVSGVKKRYIYENNICLLLLDPQQRAVALLGGFFHYDITCLVTHCHAETLIFCSGF